MNYHIKKLIKMNPIPTMSYSERIANNSAKKKLILDFLASGEVYATAAILKDLLQLSQPRVLSVLKTMEAEGSIKSESHLVASRKTSIFGITAHGVAIADKIGMPFFERGRVNSAYVAHKVDGQKMRIKAENQGWKWIPERALILNDKNLMKKIPDALALNSDKKRIAIEIERKVKELKRYQGILVEYLKEIKSGHIDFVYYISPDGLEKAVEKSFKKLTSVKVGSDIVKIDETHFSRFVFISFSDFCKG
jgi:hypothetical protein